MTGYTEDKDFFKFYESDFIDYEIIYEVSIGKLAGFSLFEKNNQLKNMQKLDSFRAGYY